MSIATRQRRWQIKKVAEGRCRQCGVERDGNHTQLCELCRKKYNINQNKRNGIKRGLNADTR